MEFKITHYIFLIVILIVFFSGCEKSQCGNSLCEKDEDSANCCLDCTCPSEYECKTNGCVLKEVCGNGKCAVGESIKNCCSDCGCDAGYYCNNNLCSPKCGDGIKTVEENSNNCCIDAGCSIGESCIDNECIVLKPEISVLFEQTTESSSVTFLKANGDSVGEIVMSNHGNDKAYNIKMVLSSSTEYFSDKSIHIGDLSVGNSITKDIDLVFLDKALDVTTRESISIDVEIHYSNSANIEFSDKESFDFYVSGRNYMTWSNPGIVSSWVTPTQPSIREFASKSTAGLAAGSAKSSTTTQRMAAMWLFESMRAYGVRYVSDAHSHGDYVQFPLETLKNKAGDCDDLSVLYASLLESIGLKSFLMLVPGHIFPGYIDNEGNHVAIEATANNFEIALLSGNYSYHKYKEDYDLIYPTREWNQYPQVNLPEKEHLRMPSITKIIDDCKVSMNLKQGFIAKAPVSFTNLGDATGAACAALNVYDDQDNKLDSDVSCWVLNPGESKEIDYIADISISNILNGYYCYSY